MRQNTRQVEMPSDQDTQCMEVSTLVLRCNDGYIQVEWRLVPNHSAGLAVLEATDELSSVSVVLK
jgi:hypothetical protein